MDVLNRYCTFLDVIWIALTGYMPMHPTKVWVLRSKSKSWICNSLFKNDKIVSNDLCLLHKMIVITMVHFYRSYSHILRSTPSAWCFHGFMVIVLSCIGRRTSRVLDSAPWFFNQTHCHLFVSTLVTTHGWVAMPSEVRTMTKMLVFNQRCKMWTVWSVLAF